MGNAERARKSKTHKPARASTLGRQYAEREKIAAVTAMLTTNREHPQSNASIEAAKLVLDAPQLSNETLHKWVKEYREQVEATLPTLTPVNDVIATARDRTIERWQKVVDKSMDALEDDEKIKNASFYHLVIAAGTGTDKLMKMTGIPASTQVIVQRLIRACARANIEHDVYLEDMTRAVEIEIGQPPKYINTRAENSTDTPSD